MERYVIRNPVPTPEQMADELGVSRERLNAIRAIMKSKTHTSKSSVRRGAKAPIVIADRVKRGKSAAR